MQGNYSEAGAWFERAQVLLEQGHSPEHPAVATALKNRAWVLEKQVRVRIVFRLAILTLYKKSR